MRTASLLLVILSDPVLTAGPDDDCRAALALAAARRHRVPAAGLPWAPPIQFCPCGPACGCVGLGYPACGSPGCPAAPVPAYGAAPAHYTPTTYAPFGAAAGPSCANGSCGTPQSYQPARGFIRRW